MDDTLALVQMASPVQALALAELVLGCFGLPFRQALLLRVDPPVGPMSLALQASDDLNEPLRLSRKSGFKLWVCPVCRAATHDAATVTRQATKS